LIATTFGSRYETALTAHLGTCGAVQEAACDSNSNDSEVEVAVQPGQTIYFEVTQVLTFEPPGGGPLVFNVSSASPANDQCTAATQIPSGAGFSHTIHTRGATTDPSDPFQTCVGPQATNAKSIWYRYTAPADGIFTAGTAGSSYDTVLSVLGGDCADLREITCDDDTIGRTSRVTFSLAAGETVYLEATEIADAPAGGVLVLRFAQGAEGRCRGDCNVDGTVAVDDLLQMVGIAISDVPLSRCEIGDEDDDGDIGLDEIIPAVSDALSGCR
jgi:hypothetical protein